jgi:hypothetical protein
MREIRPNVFGKYGTGNNLGDIRVDMRILLKRILKTYYNRV